MNMFHIAMNMMLLRYPDKKLEIKIAYNKLKDKQVKNIEEAMKMFYQELNISQ